MKFLFVLGKNQLLSLCEISHLLQFAPYKGKIVDYSKQIGIVEFEEMQNTESLNKLQYRLGGIQKICEIIEEYPKDIFKEGFPLEKHPKRFKKAREFIVNEVMLKLMPQIFLNIQNKKIMFAISVYPHLFSKPEVSVGHLIQFLNKFIKDHLKKGNNSVKYFKYPEDLLKSKDLNPIWPHHVLVYSLLEFPNAEIVFGFTKDKCYIAKTVAVDNPNVKKLIDEHRPTVKFEISIPPKLAKILLNLLNLQPNGIFLDPFCGTGTLLMFAALQGINFYGTDISVERIEAAKNNLNWVAKEFDLQISNVEKCVFKLNARELDSYFSNNYIDGIATEPYLGPPLKSPLSKEKAHKIIETELKSLYEDALSSMKKILKPNGKIAIISPIYKGKNNITVDFDLSTIAEKLGFEIIRLLPSFIFLKKDNLRYNKKSLIINKNQYIIRKINVFQKGE